MQVIKSCFHCRWSTIGPTVWCSFEQRSLPRRLPLSWRQRQQAGQVAFPGHPTEWTVCSQHWRVGLGRHNVGDSYKVKLFPDQPDPLFTTYALPGLSNRSLMWIPLRWRDTLWMDLDFISLLTVLTNYTRWVEVFFTFHHLDLGVMCHHPSEVCDMVRRAVTFDRL